MTAVHSVKCDTCATLAEGYTPAGWIKLTENVPYANLGVVTREIRWDFCSRPCFDAHAASRGVDIIPSTIQVDVLRSGGQRRDSP